MRTANWTIRLAVISGCMLIVQASAGDDAARERRREDQRERERERPATREQIQARRQANLEFWQSLEKHDPAAAIPAVKAHLEEQNAEQLAAMKARNTRIRERFKARQGAPQADDAKRDENLKRLEERFATRKTALKTQFAATIAELDALTGKEDVTLAEVRAAAQPRRARRERPDGREQTEGRERPEGRERQRQDPRAED